LPLPGTEVWRLRAERPGSIPIEEEYGRQGTAYRRARQLYAAGYTPTAVQYRVDGEVEAVFTFDGIRFVPVRRGRGGSR
jgi:hypothetical protein